MIKRIAPRARVLAAAAAASMLVATLTDQSAVAGDSHDARARTAGPTAVADPAEAAAPRHEPGKVGAHRYGLGLRGVDGVAPNDVWAVGYPKADGTVIEHWDGSAWTRAANPQTKDLAGFFAVDARVNDDVWAVGFDDPDGDGLWVPYTQHWNGSTWQVVPADPGLATAQANGVDARASDDAWIVGEGAKTGASAVNPLIEHWDGAHWRSVPSVRIAAGCDASLASVAAVAADDVWAVGTQTCEQTTALVEHWDGSRWSRVATPSPKGAAVSLEGITAISSTDVWAVGSSYQGQQANRTLTLHWNGKRWALVASPNPGSACSQSLESVSGSAGSDVWAVGSRSCSHAVLPATLHWDGSTWSAVKPPKTGFRSPAGDGFYGVTALAKNSAFAVGIAKVRGQALETGFIEGWDGSRWNLE